jgi:CubicO group peptidase (beta-lactamase class C family)
VREVIGNAVASTGVLTRMNCFRWMVLVAGLVSISATAAEPTAAELKRFQSAAKYSHAAKGTGVLVMRRGEVIFEDYATGWNAEKPHLLASGTKSFVGVMAVCAVQDGLLKLDDKVSDTLTEWKSDPAKEPVTIRQLLSLSSGIAGGDNGSVPSYAECVKLAKSTAKPGTKFQYGPIPFQCFGELMKRKLAPKGETVTDYLKRRILDPIGLNVAFWRSAATGEPGLPAGAALTPREWVKFGEMVRLGGKLNGKEVVSETLLKECFKPASANAAYGMTWWLLGGGDDSATTAADGGNAPTTKAKRVLKQRPAASSRPPADTVAAMGKGKNRCYVIPSLELVVIRMGDSEGREFSDNEFLAKLLKD